MANGAIFKFNYIGLLGLVQYFLGDWRSFEGWCISQGCNPLKENPRAMISLMLYFIERDMDDAGREKFRYNLENPGIKLESKGTAPATQGTVKLDPSKKWKAPPGWTPPGWNEEKSMAAAKSFMGFKASPK